MYDIYLWKIKPLSSYMTPWQSDTIYGHLLWGATLMYGEDETNKLIEEFKNLNSPFIVSDGFIDGELPMIEKGQVKREDTEEFSKIYGKNIVETVKKLKEINKIKNIDIDTFNKFRDGYSKKEFIKDTLSLENSLGGKKSTATNLVMHNIINRLSGGTGDNGIFSQKEMFVDGEIHIFIKIRKDFDIKKMDNLLKFIEDNGYGKKSSSGKGAIKRISFEKFDGFKEVKNPNAFVTLSNYIPKEYDYTDVIYSSPLTKRGKIGNIDGNLDFPFKKPFVCFSAGSLFKKGDNNKFGKVLEGIHFDKKIVQIGIPFTLEVKL